MGAVGGWALVALLEVISGYPPVLPWSGPLVLFFLAAVVGAMAYTTWRRVQVHRTGMEPERGIRYLALGKAAALAGAAVAAGYFALVVLSLGNISAAGPQQRVIRGSVAVVGAVLLTAVGLWLERACRIPDPPDDAEETVAGS